MILLDVTSTYAAVRDGTFDTRYRYLRERSVAGAFNVVAGATCNFNVQTAGVDFVGTMPQLFWRYQCGSYVVEIPRPTSYHNASGTLISQSLTVPAVTQTVNTVDG